MYKVIIYVQSVFYNYYLTLIKHFVSTGEIKVVGIVTDNEDINDTIDGFEVLRTSECSSISFDYALVENFNVNIPKEKMIKIEVLRLPYFSFDKYVKLLKNPISIFSTNCWAGLCYHYLGLPFSSPTINMFFRLPEFNKFLKNLDYYLSIPLKFLHDEFEPNLKRNYPVCSLGDLTLHFNHYLSFEEANAAWERRKKRVNKNNVLAISMATDNLKDVAIEFDALPIKNKIIFTSYNLHKQVSSSYPLNYPASTDADGSKFSMYINESAFGATSFINLFALLCGEKNFKRTK